ncbi:MAG: hypothetical protein K2K83_03150 [Rikenella sp.]|nr:hypothetical protein [Rikenella sp.]
MYGVGRHGFSWSSFASDHNSYYLYFYYGEIYPNYDGSYRASALQLRCLQE